LASKNTPDDNNIAMSDNNSANNTDNATQFKVSANNIKVPAGELSRMYVTHLGIILSNIAIAVLVISLCSFLGALFQALYIVFLFFILILVTICTLGTSFFFFPYGKYFQQFTKTGTLADFFMKLVTFCIQYLLPVAIVCCIASIILLTLNKNNQHKGRVIFSGAVLIVSIVVFILAITGGV